MTSENKSSYTTVLRVDQIERLKLLSKATRQSQASYIRDAVDQILAKHPWLFIEKAEPEPERSDR